MKSITELMYEDAKKTVEKGLDYNQKYINLSVILALILFAVCKVIDVFPIQMNHKTAFIFVILSVVAVCVTVLVWVIAVRNILFFCIAKAIIKKIEKKSQR